MSVDFPAPFSPSRACTSPRRRSKSTWSFATTPGKRFVIPSSSRSGASLLMLGEIYGGEAQPRPRRRLSVAQRRRRIDGAVLQLLLRLVDGGLHVLGHVALELGQQLRVLQVGDAVEGVRPAPELIVLARLDQVEDRLLERLQRARDHARPLVVLVDVDADRHHVPLTGAVEGAEAALARDLEDDVRPLVDLVERDLLALGQVLEVVR